MNIPHLFHTLTTHQPYNFQTQTITHILNRQDTLTGSGKTGTPPTPKPKTHDKIMQDGAFTSRG